MSKNTWDYELRGLVPNDLVDDLVDFNNVSYRHSSKARGIVQRLCDVIHNGNCTKTHDEKRQQFFTEILCRCPDCHYKPLESSNLCDRCRAVLELLD
jgi:hypothetical protein